MTPAMTRLAGEVIQLAADGDARVVAVAIRLAAAVLGRAVAVDVKAG